MVRQQPRDIGLLQATSHGVGAIVGGGVLILGGLALETTGASAFLAFGLNGLIALITALSFAELTSRFPESGGVYTFAKRIWSVRLAFLFGWILWLAHLVTALLYSIGFAAYLAEALSSLGLKSSPLVLAIFAAVSIVAYSLKLAYTTASSPKFENLAKLVLFFVLIIGGAVQIFGQTGKTLSDSLNPFFSAGLNGFGATMGLTFIALQGFEVIAGISSRLKEPSKNAPRAMVGSILIGLAVYLPLLFVVAALGAPEGQTISTWCESNPSTCLAVSAQNFMGTLGYWIVVAAALFSTLSALQANLLAASGLVHRMAEDRTFIRPLSMYHQRLNTPVAAISLNFFILILFLGFVRTVDVAGSAASLIFLIIYSLTHILCLNSRSRDVTIAEEYYHSPLHPWLPLVGSSLCFGLAFFQGFVSPLAGLLVLAWLLTGGAIYKLCFSDRAEAVDAFIQAFKPELLSYRGQRPTVLVPITNPRTAPQLTRIGHALATRESGQVLLLRVVNSGKGKDEESLGLELDKAGGVINKALQTSLEEPGNAASAIVTVAKNPWREIKRVARQHNCKSLVLGVNKIDPASLKPFFKIIEGDLALLSAQPGWSMRKVKRVLVPVGGKTFHDSLRARMIGTLLRVAKVEEVRFLSVISPCTSRVSELKLKNHLDHHIKDEAPGIGDIEVIRSSNPTGEIIELSESFDLVILGLSLDRQGEIGIGDMATKIAQRTKTACLILGRSRHSSYKLPFRKKPNLS